ncbi:hypothetical protein CAAN3_08S01860 [[Candida] anglica]
MFKFTDITTLRNEDESKDSSNTRIQEIITKNGATKFLGHFSNVVTTHLITSATSPTGIIDPSIAAAKSMEQVLKLSKCDDNNYESLHETMEEITELIKNDPLLSLMLYHQLDITMADIDEKVKEIFNERFLIINNQKLAMQIHSTIRITYCDKTDWRTLATAINELDKRMATHTDQLYITKSRMIKNIHEKISKFDGIDTKQAKEIKTELSQFERKYKNETSTVDHCYYLLCLQYTSEAAREAQIWIMNEKEQAKSEFKWKEIYIKFMEKFLPELINGTFGKRDTSSTTIYNK